jgi:hypothetical protein
MPKKIMPKKGKGKLLKSEQNKLSGLSLLPVSMASSWSNFLSPKFIVMDVVTSPSLHSNHLFASSWLPLTKSSRTVPTTARTFKSTWLPSTKSLTMMWTTARKLSLDSFSEIKPKTKLLMYEIYFFDSLTIFAKCKKYLKVNENPPSSQEAQLSFLLNQFQATYIKIAFAYAIGKIGSEVQIIFYPLPLCKDKLISWFLELIFDKNSFMIDSSKNTLK